MNNLIEVKELSYSYDNENLALNKVSFSINKGEKICILGANGSGKSTLFLNLNGILKPTKGKIYYNNKEVLYNKKSLLDLRKKVGIVFQQPDLQIFSSNVYEEISFGLFNLGYSIEEVKIKINSIVKELGIEKLINKPTFALSGGEKKLIAIADILVMEPEIIIFDEPFAALDPYNQGLVSDIINKISKKGITVIIATHNVDFAYEFSSRILLLKEGNLILDKEPFEFFRHNMVYNGTNITKPNVLKIIDTLNSKGYNINHKIKTIDKLIDELNKEVG